MTDYNSWFKAPVRKGVLNYDNSTTTEFTNWIKSCTGKVVVTRVLIEEYLPYPTLLPVFELEEDKVAYLLTWTEPMLRGSTAFEAGAFYAPYIPLTTMGATTTDSMPLVTIKTRYNNLTTTYDPSKSTP